MSAQNPKRQSINTPATQADFVKVKDVFLPDRHPSWSAVGVSQLAMPELCVEIRAVAVAGCGG